MTEKGARNCLADSDDLPNGVPIKDTDRTGSKNSLNPSGLPLSNS